MAINYVPEIFVLPEDLRHKIHASQYQVGRSPQDLLGMATLYRTYSRQIDRNGVMGIELASPELAMGKETWPDIVCRVIAGVFSCWKSHYKRNHLRWIDQEHHQLANRMAESMLRMEWLPPGRGLWAMGHPVVNKKGGMCLNNCAFISTRTDPKMSGNETLIDSAAWAFDALMMGAGCGFDTYFEGTLDYPAQVDPEDFLVQDSREGWVDSLTRLLKCYLPINGRTMGPVCFDYSKIRPAGTPVETFGGTASGPDPLIKLHHRLRGYCECYIRIQNGCPPVESISQMIRFLAIFLDNPENLVQQIQQIPGKTYGRTRLVVDIFNSIGSCVVSGNIRRSSLIALGKPNDQEFLDLKNLQVNPERAGIMWASNNTVQMTERSEFDQYLPEIVKRIIHNGEPGICNMITSRQDGRVGSHLKPSGRAFEPEQNPRLGTNPCGEIILEHKEMCCLSEVCVERCLNPDKTLNVEVFQQAIEFATLYASIVSTVPTHSEETNRIICRNHRIGVSLTGNAHAYENFGTFKWVSHLKSGYDLVRATNSRFAKEAGIPESLRVTTVKPSGTLSLLFGSSSGVHFPIENRYVLRSMRAQQDDLFTKFLIDRGFDYVKDPDSDNTVIFKFPLDQGPFERTSQDLSVWEQLAIAKMYQRHWSDNSVSVSVYFDVESEGPILEKALASALPDLKSLSVFPRFNQSRMISLDPGISLKIAGDANREKVNNVLDIISKHIVEIENKPMFQYAHPPYQPITREQYEEYLAVMPKVNFEEFCYGSSEDSIAPRGCDGDRCIV